DDLARLPLEHFDDRRALDLVLGDEAPEHRGFENAEADPQADGHHDDADEERDAPAPGQELIARVPAEEQHRDVGEEQAGGRAELRPRADEAAVLVGPRPFHRQQHRAAPLAADADALDQAQQRENDRAPDADRVITRHQPDRGGRDARHQQGDDEGGLAADAVAVMAEDRSSNRPRDEADEVNAERLQRADPGVGGGEVDLVE